MGTKQNVSSVKRIRHCILLSDKGREALEDIRKDISFNLSKFVSKQLIMLAKELKIARDDLIPKERKLGRPRKHTPVARFRVDE